LNNVGEAQVPVEDAGSLHPCQTRACNLAT
jgi:hypothetical protein